MLPSISSLFFVPQVGEDWGVQVCTQPDSTPKQRIFWSVHQIYEIFLFAKSFGKQCVWAFERSFSEVSGRRHHGESLNQHAGSEENHLPRIKSSSVRVGQDLFPITSQSARVQCGLHTKSTEDIEVIYKFCSRLGCYFGSFYMGYICAQNLDWTKNNITLVLLRALAFGQFRIWTDSDPLCRIHSGQWTFVWIPTFAAAPFQERTHSLLHLWDESTDVDHRLKTT